jgi:ATP-binding cassette subfamily B protein
MFSMRKKLFRSFSVVFIAVLLLVTYALSGCRSAEQASAAEKMDVEDTVKEPSSETTAQKPPDQETAKEQVPSETATETSSSARTQESIAGIKVIKSFLQEENEIHIFSKLNKDYIEKNMALAKIRAIFWPSMILIGGIGALLVLFVGGKQTIAGVITLGQFVQFSAYIGAITWPLVSLGWVINLVQRGSASMGRISNIFQTKPRIYSKEKSMILKDVKGEVKFENIYFSYYSDLTKIEETDKNAEIPPVDSVSAAHMKDGSNGDVKNIEASDEKNISTELNPEKPENFSLSGIDFTVKKGTSLGIVGFTGSGKSTLIHLIPRIYDPTDGSIYIDGHNIRDLDLKSLRSHIGFVTQEPFLFSKTIRENILLGKEDLFKDYNEDALTKKIIDAAKLAGLHDEISGFSQGYHTIIGERGITLSGGQKQRLAIARAVLADPSILIFDDSFSNVDTETEEIIINQIREEFKETTRIIVSHRISTIKDSDLIFVLDDGMISQIGTHESLIAKHGIYKRLYRRQQLSAELEEVT